MWIASSETSEWGNIDAAERLRVYPSEEVQGEWWVLAESTQASVIIATAASKTAARTYLQANVLPATGWIASEVQDVWANLARAARARVIPSESVENQWEVRVDTVMESLVIATTATEAAGRTYVEETILPAVV